VTPPDDLLVFHYEGLASRSQKFFDALGESDALVEEFVTDPVRILSEQVLPLPESLSDVEIGKANRFLYSLLSNERFMRWAEEWQKEHESAIRTTGEGEEARVAVQIAREELFRDLAHALWEYGDRETLNSIIGLDLEEAAQERDLTPDLTPAELLAEESNFRLPPLPKPVNFNVSVNVTVNFSVAAAAAAVIVVVFVIPVVVIGRVEPKTVSREDLQRMTGLLTEELGARAAELRERGDLSP